MTVIEFFRKFGATDIFSTISVIIRKKSLNEHPFGTSIALIEWKQPINNI
jgi:hypothetical protein